MNIPACVRACASSSCLTHPIVYKVHVSTHPNQHPNHHPPLEKVRRKFEKHRSALLREYVNFDQEAPYERVLYNTRQVRRRRRREVVFGGCLGVLGWGCGVWGCAC